MVGVGRIITGLRKDHVLNNYSKNNRLIEYSVYNKLKKIKKCSVCHKKFYKLQIHHKISLSEGGSNDESNLMVVCKNCHKKLHHVK